VPLPKLVVNLLSFFQYSYKMLRRLSYYN
jgi:hypothetical protein